METLEKLKSLQGRLKNDGIKSEFATEPDFIGPHLTLQMPNGSETRTLYVFDTSVDELYEFPFKEFEYLADYEAVWSSEKDFVETALMPAGKSILETLKKISLRQKGYPRESLDSWEKVHRESIESAEIQAIAEGASIRIEFSEPSASYQKLCSNGATLTFKVYGLKASSHNDAVKKMEKLSHSVAFAFDSAYGIGFLLAKRAGAYRRFGKPLASEYEFEIPKYEYDHDAMSLYWYSKRADGMPL
jgi:hypothetical protein